MIKNKQIKKLHTQRNQLCLLKQCVALTMKYFWKASMVYSTVFPKQVNIQKIKLSRQSKKLMNSRALTWDFYFP